MVKELENISEHPSTEKHWKYVNIYLADALHNLGQSEQSLPIYAQAVAEAEMRQDQEDIGLICHNWAYALRNVGKLDKAYENFLRSLEIISRNTGSTELDILATELEVLRLEIMRGQVQPQQGLPQIEQRLIQLRNLWQYDEKKALTTSLFGTEKLARLLSLLVFPRYQDQEVNGYVDHAHNDYLEFGVETGMIGLLILGSIVLICLGIALLAQYKRRDSLCRGIAFSVVMGITAILIHSSVDFNLQIPANAATFIVILAMAWIAYGLPAQKYKHQHKKYRKRDKKVASSDEVEKRQFSIKELLTA
jgi:tetratricopeptide (TPR) repeat protein